MLVLTRKANQSIMIGENIEVSVLSVLGDPRVHWVWVARRLDAGMGIWEGDALDQVEGLKLLQGAVHRHQADGRVLSAGALEDLTGVQGLIGLGQDLDHGAARRGQAAAVGVQLVQPGFA